MDILEQYERDKHLYKGLIEKITHILNELFGQNDLNLYSVTYRLKDRDSLENKIRKHEGIYSKLEDITDIGGVRITTYFEDDVKKIATLIEQEFDIDTTNSIDKKALLDPDRFGYLSMHHVVSFGEGRCKYPEYLRYAGLKAELQTRSILQHAWAEIEHDLGYKTEKGVPANIRRRFSRLAGLLELADQEFITIRNEIASYAQEVTEQIKQDPKQVSIDLVSLRSFVSNSKLVKELDREIARTINLEIEDNPEYIASDDVDALRMFQISTIEDLENVLRSFYTKIKIFAFYWLNENPSILKLRSQEEELRNFNAGISLFYLNYLLALNSDEPTLSIYIESFMKYGAEGKDQFISELKAAYEKVEKHQM